MFSVPSNSFNWSVDNFGATLTDAGFGTSVPSGGLNTKGSTATLIAGSSVTEDVHGIAIVFCGGAVAATSANFLADLQVDPAGGSSWSTLIANLLVRSPDIICGGVTYYFPLYLKAGTSIGMRHQSSVDGRTMRAGVRLFGKPSHPELLRTGTKVQTFGVNTANSGGTAITPGNGAQGSYTASLGTIANFDQFWWQLGMGTTDTTGGEKSYFFDLALGDATNKRMAAQYMRFFTDENEQSGNDCFGLVPPMHDGATGESVYARGWANTPDSAITVAAYGVG